MALYAKPNNINIVWASGGDRVAPDAAKIATGWLAEIPPRQYFNYIDWKQDQFIAYSNQLGIPEWDNNTEYQANKSIVQGSNGVVYQCLVTHTNSDPITDTGGRWRRTAIEDAPATGQQYVRRNNAWQVIDSTAFAPAVHTHPMSQIIGLENALNNKLSVTGTTPTLNSTGGIELRLSSGASSFNYLRGVVGGSNSWYVGKPDGMSSTPRFHSYETGTTLSLGDNVEANKDIYVSGSRVWHQGNFNPSNYPTFAEAIPPTRTIGTSGGLQGGGNLSADRTISIAPSNTPNTSISLSTEDLNTIVTPGFYHQSANANATSARNYPATVAGTLMVLQTAAIVQVYITYSTDGAKIWKRGNYSGWSSWTRVEDSASMFTISRVSGLQDALNGKQSTGTAVLLTGNEQTISSTGSTILNLNGGHSTASSYIRGRRAGTNGWYLGFGGTDNNATFSNYLLNTSMTLRASDIYFTKHVISAQNVQAYSDERLKTFDGGLEGTWDKIKRINSYYYFWNDKAPETSPRDEKQIGVSAQEVQAQFPELVLETDDGTLTMDYGKLSVVLLDVVKQLQDRVESLETQLKGE